MGKETPPCRPWPGSLYSPHRVITNWGLDVRACHGGWVVGWWQDFARGGGRLTPLYTEVTGGIGEPSIRTMGRTTPVLQVGR